MAQDPNAKNNKPSNKQPNKQPRQINIITIVVFALVAIFFFSMLTRMPQGSSDGITQTDSLVTSEFTQAVDQGRVESVVYDAGAETISGVYYPAQTAGVTAANAFNTGIEALNSQLGTIVNGGSRLETIEPSILQVKTLGSKHHPAFSVGFDPALAASDPDHRWFAVLLLLADEQGEQLADVVRQGEGEEVGRGASRRALLRCRWC